MKQIVRHSSHKKAAENIVKLLVTLSICLGLSGCNIFDTAKDIGSNIVNNVENAVENGITQETRKASRDVSRGATKRIRDVLRGKAVVSCDEVTEVLRGLLAAVGEESNIEDLITIEREFLKILGENSEEAKNFDEAFEELLEKAVECIEL